MIFHPFLYDALCSPQLPVPMFLPVTMDSAERIVETIQEIKEKIPSDPFEAELIFMAEMVAEDNEKNGKGQSPKKKVVEKENKKQEAPALYGEGNKKHLELTFNFRERKVLLFCVFGNTKTFNFFLEKEKQTFYSYI